MKLIKVEILLDANELVNPSDINALLEQVFKDNSHLGKLMVCYSQLKKKEHNWQFSFNGTFCTKCNQPIGTDRECDY